MISDADPASLRVMVTGGGTGGHTYPALTTIRALQAREAAAGRGVQVLWVGVAHGREATVAATEHIAFEAITTGKLRRSPTRQETIRNLTDLGRVPVGVRQAIDVLTRFRPHIVFSTGGYVAAPVGVAAWLLRYPHVLHEQTLAIGMTNRILARLADRVLLSHPSSLAHLPPGARRRAVVTGNPVRPQLLAGDAARGLTTFALDERVDERVPVVLVTGGSLGARQINQLVSAVLPDLLAHCQLIHQCGQDGIATMTARAQQLPADLARRYRPVAYLHDELPDVLAAAQLVVARSGAGTVAELTALGVATVLIPLIPTGGDEQRRTARYLADHDATVMLAGDDATPHRLRDAVLTLLADPSRREAMAVNARRLGHPDAVDRVVDELLAAARPCTGRERSPGWGGGG